MELVIDIDEYIYNQVSNNETYVPNKVEYILIENAIANGTPLPKGHGRLIDADKAELIARESKTDSDARIIRSFLKSVPTIIESKPENWKQRWIEY